MSRIPAGVLVWKLKRFTTQENLWDRVCFHCKQATPVFEYEYRDEQQREHFNYLCEECAQKKLVSWLQNGRDSDHSQTLFDYASVFFEQKNDGETLQVTRWSTEQRRRRLQGEDT